MSDLFQFYNTTDQVRCYRCLIVTRFGAIKIPHLDLRLHEAILENRWPIIANTAAWTVYLSLCFS